MEVTIHQNQEDENIYTINIGNKATIQTTWIHADHFSPRSSDLAVINCVRKITKLYASKKRKQTLIISLVPDRSTHYANGGTFAFSRRLEKLKASDYPHEIIQLCIGSHCLIVELKATCFHGNPIPPKALRDFLSDHRTVVVGIGMEKVVKMLEKDNKLPVGRAVDLRVLEEKEKGLGRCNTLEKLSKVVLGEGWSEVVRPRSVAWWKVNMELKTLSDDKIRFGTLDAFLTYEIGVKLLKDDQIADQ